MEKEIILKCEHICKSFGVTKALVDVPLEVSRGEIRGLIGNSSANIQIVKTVNVKCQDPFGLSELTSTGEVVSNEAAVKMIQEITGLDVMKRLNICMVFFPQMIWKEVWGPYLADALKDQGKTDAEVERMYQDILNGFAELNRQ